MSHAYDASGLMQGARDYIRANAQDLRDIPEPDDRWQACDVPDAASRHLQKLLHLGAVERVDKDYDGRNVYVTREQGWALVEEYADREDALLCDHGGIKNLGNGIYTCGNDACDHHYTRDTVELLLLNNTLQS